MGWPLLLLLGLVTGAALYMTAAFEPDWAMLMAPLAIGIAGWLAFRGKGSSCWIDIPEAQAAVVPLETPPPDKCPVAARLALASGQSEADLNSPRGRQLAVAPPPFSVMVGAIPTTPRVLRPDVCGSSRSAPSARS